jgi:nucleoside-diphosphate-sugar epimerase
MISSAKARRELGYSARSLQESVADAVDWFLAERKQLSI